MPAMRRRCPRRGRCSGSASRASSEGSPLRELDNVYISPHVAGITVESEAYLLEVVRENVGRVLDGQEPVNVVNGMRAKDAKSA